MSVIRAFIAIDLSEEIQLRLEEVQKNYRAQLDSIPIRWVAAENIHLTLKFLGETTPKQAEQIQKALQKIKFKQFTINLDGTGMFPNEKKPRVLWVGIKPENELCELQKKIDETLKGLVKPEENYIPHITLARIKKPKKLPELDVKQMSTTVKEFKLYESKIQLKGTEHKTLKNYPLLPQPL